MKKKSLLFIAMTVILATVINLFAGIVAFADDITTTDVIEIESADELKKIGVDNAYPLSGNYKLTANIDLDGVEWTPIGNYEFPFTGTFDGNGYTVSHFNLSTTVAVGDAKTYGIGFFGLVKTGTVKNLKLATATLTANSTSRDNGVLAAMATNSSTISGCEIASDVSVKAENFTPPSYFRLSGMVGYVAGSTLEYCINNASITATQLTTNGAFAGGLVAQGDKETVRYCVNNGTISVTKLQKDWSYVGGIVAKGSLWKGGMVIENCVNNGDITFTGTGDAANYISGGILGHHTGGTATLNNNFNFGAVTSGTEENPGRAGQILGHNSGTMQSTATNYGVIDKGLLQGTGETHATVVHTAGVTDNESNLKALAAYKAIVAEVAEHQTGVSTDLYGYQTKQAENNKFDMRLVATLSGDYTKLTNVGFNVSVTYKAAGATDTTTKAPDSAITVTKLYNSITATDGEGIESTTTTHTAASLGGDYIFVLACKGLPADATDITFTVTTFYTGANGAVNSEVETFVIEVPGDTLPEAAA